MQGQEQAAGAQNTMRELDTREVGVQSTWWGVQNGNPV